MGLAELVRSAAVRGLNARERALSFQHRTCVDCFVELCSLPAMASFLPVGKQQRQIPNEFLS